MLVSQEDIGTPHAEAMGRLSYVCREGFSYHADLNNCPRSVLLELRDIDNEMAAFTDMNMPHTIDNWKELEMALSS